MSLHHSLLAQPSNRVVTESGLTQHLVGMLAHARRSTCRQRRVDSHRRRHALDRAMFRMLEVPHARLFGNEGVVQRLGDVVHRCRRHLPRKALHPRRRVLGHQHFVELATHAVAMLQARRIVT